MALLFDEMTYPGLRPTDIRLRPYQDDAIAAIVAEFRSGVRSTLLVLPTGTGKTTTFGSVARRVVEDGGRALVLAHRGELIDQAAESLFRLGLDPAIEKAGSRARALREPDVVIATVQTMQGPRLESWPADHFDLLITDEAHHATADSYRRIYRHFDGADHLGVTATADRADETFLGEVYETVAYEMSLWDAMTAPPPGPYLCRLRFVQCDVGIDLRAIRTTGGDLNQADLEEAIRPYIETLANAVRQEVGARKTLVFTPDVGSAQAMASALHSLGVTSRWASGDDAGRASKVAAFKRGDFQVLVNCALFTEGFDCPDIAAVVLCRPTKSRALYAQMVGRGTRLAPGKADCLLVDFNWLTAKHKLVKPIELFDTTHTDSEVLEIAQGALEAAPGKDLMEAIEEAQEEQQKRRVLRVLARERETRYRRVSYDPLAAMDVLAIPVRREAQSLQGTASEKQRRALEKFGITDVETISRRRASAILEKVITRLRGGLATPKQLTHLIRNGVPPERAREMTFAEASATLDGLFNKRRGGG